MDSQRLEEEGITCLHQMAFCDTNEITLSTRFKPGVIRDWKDQSILYVLTGDILIDENTSDKDKNKVENTLFEHLRRLGIRTITH